MYNLRNCLNHREPAEPISLYISEREPKFQEDHRTISVQVIERVSAGAALTLLSRKTLSRRVVVIDEPTHSEETVEIYIL